LVERATDVAQPACWRRKRERGVLKTGV